MSVRALVVENGAENSILPANRHDGAMMGKGAVQSEKFIFAHAI
jgi:hypothetical protein